MKPTRSLPALALGLAPGSIPAAAQRMPFPVNQCTAAISFRIEASQNVVFVLGVEPKKIGDVALTSGGASVKFRTGSLMVGLGFQAGQDKPMKGLTMMVN